MDFERFPLVIRRESGHTENLPCWNSARWARGREIGVGSLPIVAEVCVLRLGPRLLLFRCELFLCRRQRFRHHWSFEWG